MTTDPVTRPRRSLRMAVAIAFVPLCLVVIAGTLFEFLEARLVHRDVQRLFEELREVALARAMVDELRGIEQWVEAAPTARTETHLLVLNDVRQHLAAARSNFVKFTVADDPSRPAHTEVETGLLSRIDTSLAQIADGLASERSLGTLAEPLAIALSSALAMTNTIDAESLDIGTELDQRSEKMAQVLLALGLASIATVGGLGWLLLRRVLRPVRDLRAGAVRLGLGDLDVQIPAHHNDELGDLAEAFRKMAAQLRESRQELEQRVEQRSREVLRTAKLAQLGTLAAGIAHEINNPLASIAACSEGLLRDVDGDPQGAPENLREYLHILHKEAMRARDITTRLLRLAHPSVEHREVFWVGEAANEVGALFAHQMADAGVRLEIVCDGRGPALHGNAAEWRQVLFNLLRNALDASPKNGRVVVRCEASGGNVVITVEDEGPGIDPEHLERLFEPFFTTKEIGKGTGLGLAIVHRIVTAHGGSITAENGARGALFRIVVPAGVRRP
ncbi:MAG TPA: HAMP domain-containing sensor histidine kinase [Planctomycetota bacterium]|nr:HAMP domain-containing sensor histidine kinase [Planctomycetota bacterium]